MIRLLTSSQDTAALAAPHTPLVVDLIVECDLLHLIDTFATQYTDSSSTARRKAIFGCEG